MKKIVKDALVLMAFSLVLGFVLGGVYSITKPVIEANKEQKELAAYKVVFEDAATLNEMEFDATATADLMARAEYAATINKVLEALDADGNILGYVVSLEEVGYSNGLMMSVGVRADGTINGFEVTSNNESGPGPGAISDEAFAKQFEGAKVDKFVGGENVSLVAGATITSSALTEGCNAALLYVQSLSGDVVIDEKPDPYKVVFENAAELKEVAVDATKAEELMTNLELDDTITALSEALDADGNKLGYVVTVTAHDGYSDGLVMVVGIQNDGTVNGFSIIEHKETKGLGTKAFEGEFPAQFVGVKADKFVAGENVDLLAGSTITSGALIGGCNAAVKYVQSLSGDVVVDEKPDPYKVVFEDAAELKEIAVDTDSATSLMTDAGLNDEITAVSEAVDAEGNLLGYVITVTAKDGYHGDIVLAVGIKLDGTVNGYSAIEHSETRNLGTKAFDEAFSSQFAGVNTDKFVSGENVELIVGATISSSSVMNACNAAIIYFNSLVGGAQ